MRSSTLTTLGGFWRWPESDSITLRQLIRKSGTNGPNNTLEPLYTEKSTVTAPDHSPQDLLVLSQLIEVLDHSRRFAELQQSLPLRPVPGAHPLGSQRGKLQSSSTGTSSFILMATVSGLGKGMFNSLSSATVCR